MAAAVLSLDPRTYRMHPLHRLERDWPETNCYVDLWIEVIAVLGGEPEAAFGFTVAQDFEGDQFTFFKPRHDELQALYGISVQELAIYDSLEHHVLMQIEAGHLVLVEVDAFYLPDTRGLSYGLRHTKTTVAFNELDIVARRAGYFHNARYFVLEGDDYDGLFRRRPGQAHPDVLFPYVEFVKRGPVPAGEAALVKRAATLLARHLRERPERHPIRAFAAALARDLPALVSRPMDYYNDYAFNTVRQLGANFELLGSHLDWLAQRGYPGLKAPALASGKVSGLAKSLLFQLARMASRRKIADVDSQMEALVEAYDLALAGIAPALAVTRVTALAG